MPQHSDQARAHRQKYQEIPLRSAAFEESDHKAEGCGYAEQPNHIFREKASGLPLRWYQHADDVLIASQNVV